MTKILDFYYRSQGEKLGRIFCFGLSTVISHLCSVSTPFSGWFKMALRTAHLCQSSPVEKGSAFEFCSFAEHCQPYCDSIIYPQRVISKEVKES